MTRWVDAIAYQAVWFAAVLGAGRGQAWPGVVAGAAFAVAHLSRGGRATTLALMATGIGFGLLLDGGLAHAGWARYAATGEAWRSGVGAPAWILALWAVFPLTLTASLSVLQSRPVVASLVGAIGGPLAYWGASRATGAVEFVVPAAQVLATLALGWGIALPVLARVAGRDAVRTVAITP